MKNWTFHFNLVLSGAEILSQRGLRLKGAREALTWEGHGILGLDSVWNKISSCPLPLNAL